MHIFFFFNVETEGLNSMCACIGHLRWWQKHELVPNKLAIDFGFTLKILSSK